MPFLIEMQRLKAIKIKKCYWNEVPVTVAKNYGICF